MVVWLMTQDGLMPSQLQRDEGEAPGLYHEIGWNVEEPWGAGVPTRRMLRLG